MDVCRSLLFVPGNRERMIAKARTAGADIIVIDLEDAVPPADKRGARKVARAGVESLVADGQRVFVRVNNVHTKLTRGDLMEIVRPGLAGVVHPKTDKQQDLRDLDVLLREAEVRNKVRPGDVAVLPLIESPAAILDLQRIAEAIDRVAGLSLGGEDYATAMGVPRSADALAHARGVIVTVAAANGIAAIDTPFPVIDDAKGLAAEAKRAAAIGFRGKYVIHPDQIAPVNSAFSPTAQEIAEARRIIAAAARAGKQRSGTVAVDGKMVDAPIVERARRVLAVAERLSD